MKTQKCTADEQYQLIMECRSSGLSDYQWCTEHNINPGAFYNWVKRLRKKACYDIPSATGRSDYKPSLKQEVVKLEVIPDHQNSVISTVENTMLPLQHQLIKEVSEGATGRWYDRQAYVTTYSVPGCYVPSDAYLAMDYGQTGPYAPACTDSGMIDSFYLFNKRDVFWWAVNPGATPDSDGTLHVWVQPAIGTKTKKNGQWVDDGVTLKNLNEWRNAKSWGNPSTFASHYNKELRIKMPTVPPGTPGVPAVTIKYQTLNAGDGYNGRQDILPNDYRTYNIGSIHAYSEAGIQSHIDWNVNNSTRRMALVGVEVWYLKQLPDNGCIVRNDRK